MTKPDQNDAIESGIGLPIATSVQTVPVGLAGGSWHRTHPAQRGKGGLGVNALRVAAGGDQQSSRSVGSYPEDANQGWGCALRVSGSSSACRSRISLSSWR